MTNELMNNFLLLQFLISFAIQSKCLENSTLSLLGDLESQEENTTSSAPQAEKLIGHHGYNLPITIRKAGPPGPILIKRSPKPRRRIKQPRPVYGPPKHNNLADPYSSFHNINPVHSVSHSHAYEEQVEKITMKDFEKFKHNFDTDLGIQTLPINQYDNEPVQLDFKKPKMKYKPKKKRVHTTVSLGKPVETYRVHGKPTENYKLLEEFVEEQFNQQLNKQLQLNTGISRDPFKPSRYIGSLDSLETFDDYYKPSPNYKPSTHSYLTEDFYTESPKDYTGKYSFLDNHQTPPQQHSDNIYQSHPHNFGSGYFAEPPASPPSTPSHYNIPMLDQLTPDLDNSQPQHNYLPPQHTGGVDFPINDKEPPYGYDYPKSSYEVPLYNSNSKMAEVEKQAELHFYPPDFHDAYQNEASFRPVEESSIDKGSGSNKIEVTLKRFPQTPVVVNPTDLPKPKYHKTPKVKVKTTTTENYPPSYSPPTTKRSYKRYRTTTTPYPTTTKRHNLDTDELRKAFESSTRGYFHRKHTSDEDELGAETVLSPTSYILPESSQEAKDHNSWEPVKVRGGSGSGSGGSSASSSRRSVLKRRLNVAPSNEEARSLKELQDEFKNIEIISVEKANSRNYYAGTVSPDFEDNLFKLPGLNDKKDLHVVSAGIQVGGNSNRGRTTSRKGQVFDDNLASSEESDDGSENLPINHKL